MIPPPDPSLPEAYPRDWKGVRDMIPIIKLCATVLCVAGTVKIMMILF